MRIEKDLYYTEDHEWIKVDGDIGYVGLTDYAQDQLGDIVYVELPDPDDAFEKGEAIGSVESVKTASDVNIPVSGTILEVNEELNDEPGLINSDPYENWIVKIRIEDKLELDDLMTADEYETFEDEE